jgi:hypothetical protein
MLDRTIATAIFLDSRLTLGTSFCMCLSPTFEPVVRLGVLPFPLLILLTSSIAVPLHHTICGWCKKLEESAGRQ